MSKISGQLDNIHGIARLIQVPLSQITSVCNSFLFSTLVRSQ